MHACDEFRERITEQLLDRSDLDRNVDVQRELLVCNSCADFYAESREMIEAFATVHFEVSDTQLDLMADRLRVKIQEDAAKQQRGMWRTWFRPYAPVFATAFALLLVTVGIYRFHVASRALVPVAAPVVADSASNVDPSIDPVTME